MTNDHEETPAERRGARDLAARFAFLFDGKKPPEDERLWFESLDCLAAFEPRPCLRSELGRESRFAMRQLTLGAASHFLAVIRRNGDPKDDPNGGRSDDPRHDREWLWPAADLPPTDIVYDCGEEILHGKAKPILCDLSTAPLRVFAILPTQVERLVLSVREGRASLGAADASGRVIAARVPFQVTTAPANGVRSHYAAADTDGWLQLSSDKLFGERLEAGIAGRSAPERTVRIRSLLNGLTAVVRLGGGKPPELLEEQFDPQPLPW
jgi:hypothetical protein